MNARLQHSPKSRIWEILERGVLREIGYPALIVSLVMFVCAMALLGANVSEVQRSYARVQRANEALLQIATVNTDILRVEMIIRGYALSGDPIYLVWKDMANASLRGRMATFKTAFAGDRVQSDHLKKLQILLDEHRAYFDRQARRLPTERAVVIAEIVEYGKKVKRRDIENLLVVMRNDEMKELAERQRLAEAKASEAYHYAIGMSGVALVLGALGFALIVNDRRLDRRRIG